MGSRVVTVLVYPGNSLDGVTKAGTYVLDGEVRAEIGQFLQEGSRKVIQLGGLAPGGADYFVGLMLIEELPPARSFYGSAED